MGPRLARLRRRAMLVLWIEALAGAALAPAGVILAYLTIVLLGLGGIAAEALALAALILTLIHAVRRFRAPSRQEADRRIETASGLAHRPIIAMEDRVAGTGGPLAMALWNAHQARLARQIAGARAGFPRLHLAERDPLGLRAALALGLLVAVLVAGAERPSRMADLIILPRWRIGPGVELASWLTPPRWSGEAPRLVGPGRDIMALPGSHLALIATGAGRSAPSASFGGHGLAWTALGGGSFRAELALKHDGTLIAGPFWNRLARYRVSIVPPAAPEIGFSGQAGPDRDERRLDVPYRAKDRYGLKAIGLIIEPAAALWAKPGMAAIPLQAAAPRRQAGVARLDLLASPYAGLPVAARLEARNIAGLKAQSAPAVMVLPAPRLTNASAREIEALRQHLALDPASRVGVAERLGALAVTPPGPLTPETALEITAFAAALAETHPLAAHPVAQLWRFVQLAEQGRAYRSGQALARARAALDRALSKMLATHHVDEAKLGQLLRRLDKALAAHAAALRDQGQAQAPTGAKPFDSSALDRLVRRIAREARQGNQEAARRDMRKLEGMLRRLQSARPMSAAQQARARAAAQAGSALSRMMRDESKLLDQTENPEPGADPRSLAKAQSELQQALRQLRQSLARAGLPRLPGLGQGGEAMKAAASHLRRGDQPGAMPGERGAIGALQHAAAALARLGQGMQGGGTAEGSSGPGSLGSGRTGETGTDREGHIDLKPGDAASPA
ncbi:MAG TPA: DUF4175 family protein, partial [Acetobacteraceae bacterium]|nr:DUF4175 family protein [Acetobacteraceae bacterium]